MQLRELADSHFTTTQLSSAILNIPPVYQFLSSMADPTTGLPLWNEVPIKDRAVKVDVKSIGLSIIPTSPIGTPAPAAAKPDARSVRMFPTYRHAKMDTVTVEDLRGVRSFGSDIDPEDANIEVSNRLDKLNLEHAQTQEFLRWGSLKGNVYDADGTTLLYNTYTLMEETQQSLYWDLENVNAVDPIQAGNDALLDYMEVEAKGEPVSGVAKICSPGYMRKMQENKAFREAFMHFASEGSINPNREGLRRPFFFKDVLYYRHTGFTSFTAADGSTVTHQFIAANEAIAIPLGTRNVFDTYFGPAEWDPPGMLGKRIHVKPDVMKLDMGIEMHSFSYSLNLVKKPRLVVRCRVGVAP